jgi:DNA-binding MarR family transcriptional regulator
MAWPIDPGPMATTTSFPGDLILSMLTPFSFFAVVLLVGDLLQPFDGLLGQLQVFLAMARLRSFTGAAREIGVSTSAVSQAIRQLEEQLRVVLLTRTTRSVSLTDPGRKLVESAGPGLAQALAAAADVAAKPGETVGRLRLTVPRTAVPFVVSPGAAARRTEPMRMPGENLPSRRDLPTPNRPGPR